MYAQYITIILPITPMIQRTTRIIIDPPLIKHLGFNPGHHK